MKVKCYMCDRKAIKLTAHRDGSYYTNAVDVQVFCSVRCAANHALLWGAPAVEAHSHFCPASGKWEGNRSEYSNNCDNCAETKSNPENEIHF